MRCPVGAVLAVAAVCMSSNAETWYAKASNYGLGVLDGRSEATAWGTLQDAHDNANDGDTILVLPGGYDQGGRSDTSAGNQHPNRLLVTKKLTFESTVPKAAHIVGQHGAEDIALASHELRISADAIPHA